MALQRIQKRKTPGPRQEQTGMRWPVTAAVAASIAMIGFALIPYDTLWRPGAGSHDLVPQQTGDGPVSNVSDVVRLYGLDARVEPYLRVDDEGIHFERDEMDADKAERK